MSGHISESEVPTTCEMGANCKLSTPEILGLLPLGLLVLVFFVRATFILCNGQKTRNPQQRRMYAGTRARPSLGQQPPTIYVSPSNLPPPPKYEAMAPPSYEEVVGIHYPNFQSPIGQSIAIQPITQPITDAVAQSSRSDDSCHLPSYSNVIENQNANATVVTVTSDERRTSVTVATNR